MTEQELRDRIKDDLEPAFFVGHFGGAILEKDDVDHMTIDELINYAVNHGYLNSKEELEREGQKGM